MAESLEKIVECADAYVRQAYGFSTTKTTLKAYDSKQWQEFTSKNMFLTSQNPYAAYLPNYDTAYVCYESPSIFADTYHELFGHALLQENTNKTLSDYHHELFALWSEHHLSYALSQEKQFEQKRKQRYSLQMNSMIDEIVEYEQKVTRLGLFGEFGLPKYYDIKQARDLLKKMIDPKRIYVSSLYGSRKPYSDIDFFVVYDGENGQVRNDWLDIALLNIDTFQKGVKCLDIGITHGLVKSDFMVGDENKFMHYKNQVLRAKPSQAAIDYNIQKAKLIADELPKLVDSVDIKTAKSYIHTHTKHARLLQKGTVKLTREGVLSG